MTMTRKLNKDNGLRDWKTEHQAVTGGCCQWRGGASYDSDVHLETVVLRRKFSDEPPNSTPPNVTANLKKDDTADNLLLK